MIKIENLNHSIHIFSVAQGEVDLSKFEDIPPAMCKAGPEGALIRIKCDDEGYPIDDTTNTTQEATTR